MRIFGVGIVAFVVLLLLGYVVGQKFPGLLPLPAALKAS